MEKAPEHSSSRGEPIRVTRSFTIGRFADLICDVWSFDQRGEMNDWDALIAAQDRARALERLCSQVICVTKPFRDLDSSHVARIRVINTQLNKNPEGRAAIISVGWSRDLVAPFARYGKVNIERAPGSKHQRLIEFWEPTEPFPRAPSNNKQNILGLAIATFTPSHLSGTITKIDWGTLERFNQLGKKSFEPFDESSLVTNHPLFRYVPHPAANQDSLPGPWLDVRPQLFQPVTQVRSPALRLHSDLKNRTTLAPWQLRNVIDPESLRVALASAGIEYGRWDVW